MLRVGGLSDVLTPLSDCRQESTEKMDRSVSGVSYICGMDFHNGFFLLWDFMCSNNITLCFDSIFASILRLLFVSSTATTPRATTPHLYCKGITPSPLHGYHACVFISRLSRHSSEFHFWVITPELSRSTTQVNRVITPALVSSS